MLLGLRNSHTAITVCELCENLLNISERKLIGAILIASHKKDREKN